MFREKTPSLVEQIKLQLEYIKLVTRTMTRKTDDQAASFWITFSKVVPVLIVVLIELYLFLYLCMRLLFLDLYNNTHVLDQTIHNIRAQKIRQSSNL